MKSSVYGVTAAASVLAAALSVTLAGPHRAYAAPTQPAAADLSLSLLSPAPHSTFTGAKPVEIDAFYQGTDSVQITEVDLYIDGVKAATKALVTPESRGVISFLIDASALTSGSHRIVVRAVATDAEVVSTRGDFSYAGNDIETNDAGLPSIGGDSTGAPDLSITSPSEDSRVEGSVKISVSAHDASGKDPYVSYFVDRSFKSLRNFPPYDFVWDSTTVPNGLHTVEIYAYNDQQNVGPAKILKLYVNNPGGYTGIRTDLKDGITAPKSLKAIAPVLRPHAQKAVAPVVTRPVKAAIAAPILRAPAIKAAAPAATKTVRASLMAPILMGQTHKTVVPAAAKPKRVAVVVPVVQSKQIAVALPISAPKIVKSLISRPIPEKALPAVPAVTRLSPSTSKSLLAPARMARTDVTLNSAIPAVPTTEASKTGKMGISFESALTSPFKSVKLGMKAPFATPKPVVEHSRGSALLANSTPTVPSKASRVPPALQMASLRLPSDGLSLPFLAAPHAPVIVEKPSQLHPMLMRTAIVKQEAARPIVTVIKASKSVRTMLSIPAVKTDTRRIAFHVVLTPGLVNLLRCKGEMAIMVNNSTVHLDRPLQAHGSVLFGPLRQIFEFEGGQLVWKSQSQRVIGHSPSRDISLQIGSRNAEVNAKEVRLSGAPFLQRGRTMVPVQLLPMALDATMQYNPTNGHLLITSKN